MISFMPNITWPWLIKRPINFPTHMSHLYQSVKRWANQKIEANVFESKGEKKLFVCGKGGTTSPLKTPPQVQDCDGPQRQLNAVMHLSRQDLQSDIVVIL